MKKISILFLIASWVIYFATDKGIVGAIFLILSGSLFLNETLSDRGDDHA